ncbi:hypothetical protein NX059_000832 [Plenodomus lindquistii]|nr:hypothetical protein NX059_000832 [Plenodomus lindquistii]
MSVPVKEMGDSMDIALPLAASHGYEKITELLLKAGANVNARRYVDGKYVGGESALQRASTAGHDTSVRLLLEAGAKASRRRDSFYGSALQKASERGHVQVVELLLGANAHVNLLRHASVDCCFTSAGQQPSMKLRSDVAMRKQCFGDRIPYRKRATP